MATQSIASMLDELMGRNRNLAPDDAANISLTWQHGDVCRYYLVLFCPHDLFTNTKADMGPCGKIHDDDLKQKFHDEKESYKKSQYLDEFLRFCQKSLSDLQSRIKKAKERLLLTQQAEEAKLNAGGSGVSGGQNREIDEKIILLSEKISALVAEAEQAGCRGDVEEAQGLMKLCDQLREERDTLRRTVSVSNYGNDYGTIQKAMEVCDICGAFLIVGDAQQRIDDHLLGKQHVGYARLRTATDEVSEMRKKFREIREKEVEGRRLKDRDHKRRSRDRSPSAANKDKERKRSRSRDRKRSEKQSSRSRDNDDRKRTRSRERKRSSGSRSRDRDRDRSKREKRSRSREHNHRRRSRSRDRHHHHHHGNSKHDRNSSTRKDTSKSPSRSSAANTNTMPEQEQQQHQEQQKQQNPPPANKSE